MVSENQPSSSATILVWAGNKCRRSRIFNLSINGSEVIAIICLIGCNLLTIIFPIKAIELN
jgi:hypothetical protein